MAWQHVVCVQTIYSGNAMDLIRKIRIENFRSIDDLTVPGVGPFNVFVGKNSSGKSNVLRALNLFFNDELEPGKRLNFGRDYFQRAVPSKKKKRISVSVDFSLPETFKFRKGLEGLTALGHEFRITRAWELDQRRIPFSTLKVSDSGVPILNSSDNGRQFLALISYRYIPNRTNPADLLRDESQAVADSIFMRMKGDRHAAALLENLSAAAGRMLGDANSAMKIAESPLTEPRVALGQSMGEMLTMSGFQATTPSGGDVQDEDWGAGHQAFFLYQVLHALDTNYGRFFGWRQATVWGVEEPESALHRDLETRLAESLRQWSGDGKSRMQTFVTTHSPVMTMAAENGYWTEIVKGQTNVSPMPIPELTRAAEVRGVTGWVHPILSFPWNPVVLVEGPIDVDVLYHAAAIAGSEQLRFLWLQGLDPTEKQGGKDAIISYLRKNQGLIQNRPSEAPLVVLFDWEVSAQDLQKAKKAYGARADDYVLSMNANHCDPLLGKTFKGIERFYPPKVILDAHKAGEMAVAFPKSGPYSVAPDELNKAKNFLRKRLLHVDSTTELKPLMQVIADLEVATRGHAALQLSLPGLTHESIAHE